MDASSSSRGPTVGGCGIGGTETCAEERGGPCSLGRVLIVRPSALGDVARSICLAHSIKQAHPGCVVDWLVQDGFAPVLEASGSVDRLIRFDRAGLSLRRVLRGLGWWGAMRGLLGEIRRERYDAVIDAQGLARSALFARVARTRVRVGYARPTEPVRWLYSRVPASSVAVHTVDRMLELLEPIGVPAVTDLSLTVPACGEAEVEEAVGAWCGRWGRVLVLAPTSRWASKRWPIDRWRSLCAGLLEADEGCGVAVIGAPGEAGQCGELLKRFRGEERVLDCVGGLSIAGTMALISRSSLVVANDSAPLHMAVGLGVRSVGLFGPTDPSLVGPYGGTSVVVRSPGVGNGNRHREKGMDDRLMRGISVDAVLGACRASLSLTCGAGVSAVGA